LDFLNTLISPFSQYLPENNTLERIWVLAKVDFKSRYYYHKLGILWALIRPIMELAIYYVIFNTIFKSTVENFALYLCGGLLLWYYFTEGTTRGIAALLSKRYLIESVPFNKFYIILASTLSSFLGFLFNISAYLVISVILNKYPEFPFIIQLIPILIITSVLILGISLILATLSIYLKDIQHLWDMIVMAGFWITPIVYQESLLLDSMPNALYFNPMGLLVVNLHQALLYNEWIDLTYFIRASIISLLILLVGAVVFNLFSHKAAEKL
jgi:ABC-type polysaccharide/polyol phosphate export permease